MSFVEILLKIAMMLGGLAMFLYGMSMMTNGLEKMAGGKLEIESKLGEGTLVRVTLPYQKEVTA